ncbi:carboxypeptidase family protein [Colwellia sp. MB02u-10]|uniref:M14 family metallopeptidase n=1 Tax=Colwellia sp. MB02u-10 TaxID=2759828 RepID=UPI0015F6B734|nr:carboxypeptidase family protein [Colwellia sp. MB02u-10]MBA6340443.1 carboxypeptidase family protein [Colwellia sp. MB02u-10]
MMRVDDKFDGGNIELIDISKEKACLNIKKDSKSDEKQWFYFRASGIKNIRCNFEIANASTVSYPEAWPTCSIVASYDRKKWFRVPTFYNGKTLTFNLQAENDIAYFALFEPYSYERHLDLISWSLTQDNCALLSYCETLEHNQIELLQIGTRSNDKKNIWIIARQHPAETMAEWFIEGLLKKILSGTSLQNKALLDAATFYILPNMNPDGAIAGNLRTNGAGIDLNRSWLNPNKLTAPESHFVFEQMKSIGVDLFLDIHGDEDIPYAFIAGSEGNPSYTKELALLDTFFRAQFNKATPDFCVENGYKANLPGAGDLRIACNQVGEYFNCLSLTIEMPFTDNKYQPNKIEGWNAQRSMALGAAVLTPIRNILPKLTKTKNIIGTQIN